MEHSSIIPFLVAFTSVLFLFVVFIVVYVIVQKQRQYRDSLKTKQMVIEHNNALLHTRIIEQEKTMNTVSTEIHDSLGQKLSLSKMLIQLVSESSEETYRREKIQKTSELLDNIIYEAQNLSHRLNSGYIMKKGLITLLQEEVNYVNENRSIRCSLTLKGEVHDLEPETELNIFRIAQEAINNVIKHAGASELNIIIECQTSATVMEVRDNGIGMAELDLGQTKGIGLSNMQQRAAFIGGTLTVETADNGGCRLLLKIPNIPAT